MQTKSRTLNWPHALWLLLPLWMVGLFMRGYWTPDEPREADIAWRMTQQMDRSLPHLAEQRFLEKPPLSYWLAADAQQMFGTSSAATRIPNLLYVLLACASVGLLARHMAGRRAAFVATLVFGSMFEVYRVAIWLAPDASLVAGCALALLGAYRGFGAVRSSDKLLWYTVMHAGALMGFMAKSAPGWLVPALALLTLIAMERRWREIWNWTLWAGVLLQVLVIGLWVRAVLAQPEGMNALKVMFWNNLAGRFTDIHASGALNYAAAHQNYFGKYLLESPYYLFPWILLVLASLYTAWSKARGDAGRPWRFAIAASLPFALLLSLAATARDVYFAPVCVGLAILVALWLESLPNTAQMIQGIHGWALRITRWMALAFAALVLVLLAVVAHELREMRIVCMAGVTGVVLLLVMNRPGRAERYNPWQTCTATYSVYAGSLLIAALCLMPIFNQVQDLHALASAIHRDTQSNELAILRPDETTIAMLDYEVGKPVTLMDGSDEELLAQSRAWLQADPSRRLVVKLPGSGPGPLTRIIKPGSHDRDDGLAAQLNQAEIARVLRRYDLPHGRRYAVLGPAGKD